MKFTDEEFEAVFDAVMSEQPEEFQKSILQPTTFSTPKPEHLKILLQGMNIWNEWRRNNPKIKPALNCVDLTVKSIKNTKIWNAEKQIVDLSFFNFGGALLHQANFEGALLLEVSFRGVYFSKAHFQGSDLNQADFEGAILWNANFEGADLSLANFEGADLSHANFEGAEHSGANFEGADLRDTNFENADINGIKYKKETKIGKTVLWKRNTIKSCKSMRVATSYGNPLFKRYAQDQDYLEHFKEDKPVWYWLWKVTCNCGQSFSLWAFWSMLMAFLFGAVFAGSLPECLNWLPGIGHINGFLQDIKPELLIGEKVFRTKFTPYYFSIVTLTTLGFGDVIPKGLPGEIWITVEVILGYIMLGGLISIFANKVARRS